MSNIHEEVRKEKAKQDKEEIKSYLVSMSVVSGVAFAGWIGVGRDFTQGVLVATVVPFISLLGYWLFGACGFVESKTPAWWHLTAAAVGLFIISKILDNMF
jgi:hypothetical protein